MALRKNESLLEWLRAAGVALLTYLALTGIGFAPAWGAAALALAAGGLTLASIGLGALVTIVAIALPLLAVAPIAGSIYLVLALLGLRFMTESRGGVLFVVAASIAGAFFGPAWAAVALAGFFLGATEGAIAAGFAAVCVQVLGIAAGRQFVGAVTTGGKTALLDLSRLPDSLFSASWVGPAFNSIGADGTKAFIASVSSAQPVGILIAQPLLWAAGAAITAMLVRTLREGRLAKFAPAGVLAGALVPAAGAMLLHPLLGLATPAGPLSMAAVASVLIAVVVAFFFDYAFPVQKQASTAAARPGTMAAEDADVDELLRLIATAEDKLTTQHTSNRTVMITDMKSFSRMAEEDGSMLTAKAIQRHRDLLLPIVERHGGKGKSTGGDGLVASFDDASSALFSAIEMQKALRSYNDAHPDDRELSVRVGIAEGEVVLDRGGRPFIGTALNLAARVMNLADGGQVFTTSAVGQKATGGVRTHSHGRFELKNIAEPVDVVEILWVDGQVPSNPHRPLAVGE